MARIATSSGSTRRRSRTRLLQKDARIGDLAFNRADKSIWGVRHLNGLSTLVRMKPPYTRLGTSHHVAVWHGHVRHRRVAGRLAACRARSGRSAAQQDVRVFEAAAIVAEQPDAGRAIRLRHVGAERVRVLARRTVSVRQLLFHRRPPISSGTTSQRRKSMPSAIPIRGSSGPFRSPTARCSCSATRGAVSFRPGSIPHRSRTSAPITFFGEQLIEEWPVLKTWMLDSPAKVPFDTMEKTDGCLPPRRRAETRIGLPRRPGLQGHGGRRHARSTSPTR